jgi:hypothetical protein
MKQIEGGSPLIYLFSNIIEILNGRDSNGQIVYFGPNGSQVHRYLLLAFIAKSAVTFRILGKQIDNSLYFTNYSLNRIANYFKSVKPFYIPINYGRRKVAQKMYEILARHKYVDLKKINGETYITTTVEGDEICHQLLRELITFAHLSDIAPSLKEADLSHEVFKIKKGTMGILRENANLKMAADKITEDFLELNSQFKEEIKGIEDEL